MVQAEIKTKTVEFIPSNTDIINSSNISNIIGTRLDNAQYISLLLKNSKTNKNKIKLGALLNTGKKYNVSLCGSPTITNYKGEIITKVSKEYTSILEQNRETELNYDSLAHLEVEGQTLDGGKFLGVYYSLGDAIKFLEEDIETGGLLGDIK